MVGDRKGLRNGSSEEIAEIKVAGAICGSSSRARAQRGSFSPKLLSISHFQPQPFHHEFTVHRLIGPGRLFEITSVDPSKLRGQMENEATTTESNIRGIPRLKFEISFHLL